MKMSVRFSLLLLTALLLVSKPSLSNANACITDFKKMENNGVVSQLDGAYSDKFDGAQLYQAALSCQDLKAWKMGLKAATYTFNLTALAFACTEVGVPVSVGMFGVGSAIYTAELVIDSIPCEDSAKEDSEALVRDEVCKALAEQGIACDSAKLERR
jgi:hypothetical protein